MEGILWKPFQLLRRILNASNITKAPSNQCWFHSREQVNPICSQSEYGGWCSVVTFSFSQKFLTKPTGVLEHCRETKCWFSIFRGLSFWPHPQGDRGCQSQLMRQKFPSSSNSCKSIPENSENFLQLLRRIWRWLAVG